MTEEEPGSRKIIVTITPQGMGKINVDNEGGHNRVPFPAYMTGDDARRRTKEMKKCIVGYRLEELDLSRAN